MKKDINYFITRILAAGLVAAIFCIGITMFTYHVCYEKYHMENGFVQFFTRSSAAGEAEEMEFDADVEIVEIDFAESYPFSDSARQNSSTAAATAAKQPLWHHYTQLVEYVQAVFNAYSGGSFLFHDELQTAASAAEHILCPTDHFSCMINDQIILTNGRVTSVIKENSETDTDLIAENILELNDFLDDRQIPFLYVNAPSKLDAREKDRLLPKDAEEYSNENVDALLERLSGRVDTYDFRDTIQDQGLSYTELYYAGDHHWKTSTGLWAAGELADYLNENYGYHFDEAYFDKSSYSIETECCFYGSNYRGIQNNTVEDFEIILPLYDTNYTVDIPTKSYHRTGSYTETLFRLDFLEAVKEKPLELSAGAYSASRLNNDAISHIENLNPTNNDGKKILLLADSFNYYLATYLAADIEYLDVLHPASFNGSIQSYIEETDPDLVILFYYAKNIEAPSEEELQAHTGACDFR